MHFEMKTYDTTLKKDVLSFLEAVFPESGKILDLDGRHREFHAIEGKYEAFWCLYDEGRVIGTVGLKSMGEQKCELKALYLYENYHGKGLGYRLLSQAIAHAKAKGYRKMYLDTMSTSKRAIHLYESVGFTLTERYNENYVADVFMVMELF